MFPKAGRVGASEYGCDGLLSIYFWLHSVYMLILFPICNVFFSLIFEIKITNILIKIR